MTLPPFPPSFFDRADESSDIRFYAVDRLLTHIDDGAIAAVTELYDELGLTGEVLDLCSSWISHFSTPPRRLVALGMNATELAANDAAAEWLVHDLNVDPSLPFADASFDAVTCCVSVDYLTRPLEVFAEVARVLRPSGSFACTFSNRCFPRPRRSGDGCRRTTKVTAPSSAPTSNSPTASASPRSSSATPAPRATRSSRSGPAGRRCGRGDQRVIAASSSAG